MKTPIGSIQAEMTFRDTSGAIEGVAVGVAESVQLRDVRSVLVDGSEHVTWSQSITKPIRLHLHFDVVVHGDRMHGHSQAGRLPRSTVTGHRLDRGR